MLFLASHIHYKTKLAVLLEGYAMVLINHRSNLKCKDHQFQFSKDQE